MIWQFAGSNPETFPAALPYYYHPDAEENSEIQILPGDFAILQIATT